MISWSFGTGFSWLIDFPSIAMIDPASSLARLIEPKSIKKEIPQYPPVKDFSILARLAALVVPFPQHLPESGT